METLVHKHHHIHAARALQDLEGRSKAPLLLLMRLLALDTLESPPDDEEVLSRLTDAFPGLGEDAVELKYPAWR